VNSVFLSLENIFMNQKIIIDVGNTRVKYAVFQGEEMISFFTSPNPDLEIINKLLKKFPQIHSGILSSVKTFPKDIEDILTARCFFIQLGEKTPLPFYNKYQTPETLGNDRLAIAAFSQHFFPDKNVLAISAGTTITYDFINQNREYLGGNISPGLQMRLKALHQFTEKLPLIYLKDLDYLIGTSTETSILSGVLNGAAEEIAGIIEQYKKQFEGLKIILGGGDYKYFDKRLKNNIFASPNIVLEGLKVILDFNEKN